MHECEGTAVAFEADTVGRDLEAVLEEGNRPREGDDADEWPGCGHMHLLEFEVAIPRKGHEDVGTYKEENGVKSVHCFFS